MLVHLNGLQVCCGGERVQYLLTEEGVHCGEVFLTFLCITFTSRAVLHGLFVLQLTLADLGREKQTSRNVQRHWTAIAGRAAKPLKPGTYSSENRVYVEDCKPVGCGSLLLKLYSSFLTPLKDHCRELERQVGLNGQEVQY